MELDFDSAYLNSITKEEILSKVSEYDIFRFYISNFKELERAFSSELRKDDNPSCYITNKYNNLIYKDFGNGDVFTCFDYVAKKFNSNFFEALNIIGNDFNIRKNKILLEPRDILSNDEFKGKNEIKTIIRLDFIKQPWTKFDFIFWNQYHIDFELLDYYNVISAKQTILYKNNKRIIFYYDKKKPRYGYLFDSSSKAYSPYENKLGKWMNDGNSIEGWEQLDAKSDLLIITKSLKDCLIYHLLDINAIALPSETYNLKQDLVDKLKLRFNKIILNFDGDKQGINSTNKLVNQYKFDYFYIPEEKDVSDYVKINGLDKAKQVIEYKLKEINDK